MIVLFLLITALIGSFLVNAKANHDAYKLTLEIANRYPDFFGKNDIKMRVRGTSRVSYLLMLIKNSAQCGHSPIEDPAILAKLQKIKIQFFGSFFIIVLLFLALIIPIYLHQKI